MLLKYRNRSKCVGRTTWSFGKLYKYFQTQEFLSSIFSVYSVNQVDLTGHLRILKGQVLSFSLSGGKMKANLTNLLFLLAATSLAILASIDEVKGNQETDLIVGADGLQCNSCGAECSVMCGSRKFRTCCFNYIKKRSSGSSIAGSPLSRHPTKSRILYKRQSESIPIQQQQQQLQQMQQQLGDEILETTKQLNDGGLLTRVETLPLSAITLLVIPDKVLVDQRFLLQSSLSKLKENSESQKNSYH